MNWQEVLTLLVPILGMMTYFYNRVEKKADERQAANEKKADERQVANEKKADERYQELLSEIKEIKKDLASIRDRLTRLEGRFDERGYWESREWHRTGTDDKK